MAYGDVGMARRYFKGRGMTLVDFLPKPGLANSMGVATVPYNEADNDDGHARILI